jgi:hypothetical protein
MACVWGFFAFAAFSLMHVPDNAAPEVLGATLAERYARLPVPAGDTALGALEVVNKGRFSFASRHYLSDASPEEAVRSYRDALVPKGWILTRHVPTASGSVHEQFCRDGIQLLVEASKVDQGASYYLRLAWTNIPSDNAFCPVAPITPRDGGK